VYQTAFEQIDKTVFTRKGMSAPAATAASPAGRLPSFRPRLKRSSCAVLAVEGIAGKHNAGGAAPISHRLLQYRKGEVTDLFIAARNWFAPVDRQMSYCGSIVMVLVLFIIAVEPTLLPSRM
jgi:hypothetical protein